jgi:iron complex outermembrane receptor protein
VSVSAGVVWDFTEGYNVGVSVSRSERAPSPQELLSFGPHIGTGTYEVGALFAMHDDEDGMQIGLTDEVIDLETSNNIDLTFRKTEGSVGFVFNAFYNRVDNYYYQIETGLFAPDGHDHGSHDHGGHDDHDHGHDDHNSADESGHEHEGELPVFITQTDDVELFGFEAQVAWQVNDEFKASFFSDYVRARLQNGGDLPRIPPLRLGGQFSYQFDQLGAFVDVIRYQEQDRVSNLETATDGYTMVDVNVTYDFQLVEQDLSAYFRISNLTDTEARVHTSFLKDIAPRPGRSFAFGIRGFF